MRGSRRTTSSTRARWGRLTGCFLKEAFKSIAWLQRGLEDRFQTAQVV
jgi:hypothetical protein